MTKVIHIVENLDKGAVENWLVNVFIESRKINSDLDWTFYCILGVEGKLDNLVRNAGGSIIYSPVTISQKYKFLRILRKELQIGNYDILHVHHDFLSGFYLLATIGIKFKKKILHIHNTDKLLPVSNKCLQQFLLKPLRYLGIKLTDQVIGISKDVLFSFVGNDSRINSLLLYYGIDLIPFENPVSCEKFRQDLNLPKHAKIILFVGRMNILKNPVWIVDLLEKVRLKNDNIYAVFVGKGELEGEIAKRAI